MTTTTIEYKGLLLRKVSRKYKNGDFVVFSEKHTDSIVSKPYEIRNGDYTDECGDIMSVTGWNLEPNPAIYEVVPQYFFKVGDKVIPSTLSAADRDYIGQTGVVTMEGSGDGGIDVLMSDGWTAIYKPKTLTLAVEAPTLKKGDRVKILAISKHGKEYVGEFGIVETVNFSHTGYASVEPESGEPNGLYLPEQLELAPQSIEPGDEVEVLGLSVFGFDAIGKVGFVKRIFDESFREVGHAEEIVVDLQKGEANRVYKPENLKLLRKAAETKIELKTEGETTLTNKTTVAAAAVEFKAGDKVRLISSKPRNGFGNVKTGDVGTIDTIRGSGGLNVSFPSQSYWSGYSEEFELVVDEPKFKVGDKVRVLDASAGRFGDQVNGAIGDIESYHEGTKTYRVSIDGDFDRYSASALELFVEPVDEFGQFQPGDKVTLLSGGNDHPLYGFHNGGEYEVVNNECIRMSGARTIEIKPTTGYNGFALPSQLKKVEAKVEKIVVASSPAKFAVGDYIRILNKYGIDGGCDLTDGDDYEIISVDSVGDIEVVDDAQDELCIMKCEFGAIEKVDAPAPKEDVSVRVGDFVVFTNADAIDCHSERLTNGKMYEVTELNDPGFFVTGDDSQSAYIGGYEIEYYEKVDAPAPALKVGDYITIDFSLGGDANFTYIDLTEGKAYKVYENHRGDLAFKDDVNDQRTAQIKQGAYTIIEGPTPTPAKAPVASYKVGDRVVVTDGGYSLEENQKKGTITYVSQSGDVYAVKLDNHDGMCSLNFYTSEIVSLLVETPPVASRGFQLGDIVRIDLQREFGGSINRNGDIGEVTELNHGMARVHVQGRGGSGNFELLKELTLLVANENREDK